MLGSDFCAKKVSFTICMFAPGHQTEVEVKFKQKFNASWSISVSSFNFIEENISLVIMGDIFSILNYDFVFGK